MEHIFSVIIMEFSTINVIIMDFSTINVCSECAAAAALRQMCSPHVPNRVSLCTAAYGISSWHAGSASNSAADSNNGVDLPDVDGAWQCRHCTFANTNVDADTCEVCEQSRYNS